MPEKITGSDLLEQIVWDDSDDYRVVATINKGNSRWHRIVETVFRRVSDGKLFLADWRKGATEDQDHQYPDEAVECEPYTETVTKYRRVV